MHLKMGNGFRDCRESLDTLFFFSAGGVVLSLQDARGSSGWEEPKRAKVSWESLILTKEGRRNVIGSMMRRGKYIFITAIIHGSGIPSFWLRPGYV